MSAKSDKKASDAFREFIKNAKPDKEFTYVLDKEKIAQLKRDPNRITLNLVIEFFFESEKVKFKGKYYSFTEPQLKCLYVLYEHHVNPKNNDDQARRMKAKAILKKVFPKDYETRRIGTVMKNHMKSFYELVDLKEDDTYGFRV